MTEKAQDMNVDQGVVTVDADPFSPEALRNPYPLWAQLRDAGPVVWIPKYGYYLMARHAEVQAAQQNWQNFTTSGGAGMSDIRKPGAWRKPGPIVEVDPPDHTKIRKVVNAIVSPVVVRGWRERFQRDANALVDGLLQTGRFDGVRDVAEAYVLKVFPESMGIDLNREQAIAVGDLNFNSLGPNNELVQKSREQVAPFIEWWEESLKGQTMKPGGFGEKLFLAERAGELAPGLASGLTMTFLRGGLDTTISSIGSALWLLAAHPDQWQLLKQDPALVRGVFEETLRLESPIKTNFRTTRGECTMAGITLKDDTKVQLLLGSANRDPRKWSEPDAFDIRRATAGHVALGTGIHACVGQMIARLEFDCVLNALLAKVERIELDGTPRHRMSNALHTLDELPLRVHAHA